MIDEKTCRWLMDNAGVSIRYRVLREFLKDRHTANKIEKELLNSSETLLWLNYLKPKIPPQHSWMEHGSFNFNFENALLKACQLGLHAELPPMADAVIYYLDKIQAGSGASPVRGGGFRTGFDHILIANLLSLAGFNNNAIHNFMKSSLDELFIFVEKNDYNIYCTLEEQAEIKGIPAIWKDRKIISPSLYKAHGFSYPLLYDIIGLHTLYDLNDQEITSRINYVIDYVSTDGFHDRIMDGYGIVPLDNAKCLAMGWDPKYPGWYNVEAYLKSKYAPKLLFFAQCIVKYPSARRTKWIKTLLSCFEAYRTDCGTYLFPAHWLKEKPGYAVLGSHLSFGENRRKRNWREIESTFYVQLLKTHL